MSAVLKVGVAAVARMHGRDDTGRPLVFQAEAEELNLSGQVEVTGFVDHAEAIRYCQEADALVLALDDVAGTATVDASLRQRAERSRDRDPFPGPRPIGPAHLIRNGVLLVLSVLALWG